MSTSFYYQPPVLAFDATFADQLACVEAEWLSRPAPAAIPSPSPYADYHRSLTAEGGILIEYKDIERGSLSAVSRIALWMIASLTALYVSFPYVLVSFWLDLVFLSAPLHLYVLVCGRRRLVAHSVEIQPDRMIIDGKDLFFASEIDRNWPQLVFEDEYLDRAVIAGICGSRYIEYMTVNRRNRNDVTPELLEAHLREAMTQLWDRFEVTFEE